MWIKIALAVGVLGVAAAPQFFPLRAAPEPQPALSKSAPAPATFKPVCRGDEVLDSRPDPAWVRQSFNQDNCRAPNLPPLLDGAAATREQVVAAMAASKAYAAAAEAFQMCVSDFVAAKRAEASQGGKALTPSQVIIENHRILVSQRAVERAAAQTRVAINAFNMYGSACE
jgi:hypothetical protein